jgi:DNA-binding HxlR family transcriptional regulator
MLPKKSDNCPILKVNMILGDKWNLLILWHLLSQNLRFCELQRLIPEINSRTLTEKLKILAEKGLISRKQFSQIPVRVEYSLTKKGMHLKKILEEIRNFAKDYM